jgi:methylated-DNA-protein-cysteine methyltransferase-like protein
MQGIITPMDDAENDLEIYTPVYEFVRTVPPGKVVTYGQVAGSIRDVSLTPRQVGTAMRYAPPDVPWQRVIGAGGYLRIARRSAEKQILQRRLLEQEGVAFLPDAPDRVDMSRHQWLPSPGGSAQGSLFADDEETP